MYPRASSSTRGDCEYQNGLGGTYGVGAGLGATGAGAGFGASRVRMVTRHHGSYVEIRVEDDGAGFDLQNIQHGRGLKSQIKRAQALGGKLRVDSSPGNGTRLSLRLPVERKGGA